jgi:hypothetical protein
VVGREGEPDLDEAHVATGGQHHVADQAGRLDPFDRVLERGPRPPRLVRGELGDECARHLEREGRRPGLEAGRVGIGPVRRQDCGVGGAETPQPHPLADEFVGDPQPIVGSRRRHRSPPPPMTGQPDPAKCAS